MFLCILKVFLMRYAQLEASGKHRLRSVLTWISQVWPYLVLSTLTCLISSNWVASDKTTLGVLKGWKLHVDFLYVPRLGLMYSTQLALGLPENGKSMQPFNWKSDTFFCGNKISIFTQYYFINKHWILLTKSGVLLISIAVYPCIYDCRKLAVRASKVISVFSLKSSPWQWLKLWLVWQWAYLQSFEIIKRQEVGNYCSMTDLERLANLAVDSFIIFLTIF